MDTISPQAAGIGGFPLFTGVPQADPGGANRVPALRRLWRLVQRRRWVLGSGLMAGALIGTVLTVFSTRQYTSTGRLEISRATARVVNIDSVERETSIGDQEFYQTQYGLLQTYALAQRVVRDLGLADNREFFRMFGRGSLFPSAGDGAPSAEQRAKLTDAAARILLDHVGVAPVRGSSLVDVSAVTPDPVLSQRIAATWAQDFIASNIEQRFEASSYARHFLESRLDQLRQKLESSERDAVAYAARNGIINLPSPMHDATGNSAGDRSLVTDDLGALNAALDTATADRILAQSRLAEAAHPDSSTEALSNTAIAQLRQKRAEVAADYGKLMVLFQPTSPQAQQLSSQIHELDTAIAQEESRIHRSLDQGFRTASAREAALSARVSELKGSFADLRRRSIQYNIFQREADTNRELYGALLQRYKEVGVAGAIDNNNIAVVDAPRVPTRPSSPSLPVNIILAMLAGGVLAVLAVAALEQIDEGIGDPGEIEEKLGLPLLGSVPRVTDKDPLLALQEPRSPLVEAYLAVQANLNLSTAQGMPHSLAVISTRPREGKSITAIALAQSLARVHKRVALVDADMRSPSIHTAFGIANAAGLSNLLAGSDDLAGVLHETARDGLSILPAGPPPPNAAELLTGERLAAIVHRLLDGFDHVIVDSPPVMGLADAALVAASVDSVVFAVEARAVPAEAAQAALQRLRAGHARILGAVLTKFDARRDRAGHGYDGLYGYGYATSD